MKYGLIFKIKFLYFYPPTIMRISNTRITIDKIFAFFFTSIPPFMLIYYIMVEIKSIFVVKVGNIVKSTLEKHLEKFVKTNKLVFAQSQMKIFLNHKYLDLNVANPKFHVSD